MKEDIMKKIDRTPDKHCSICNKPIYNGVNGCSWYSTCFDCKPIHYPAPAMQKIHSDEAADYWEGQILARQERYWDE